MLTGVIIERFKNLEDVSLSLDRINVLVGTNNSGKSSILQGIAFAVSVAQTAKMLRGVTTLSPEQLIYAPLRDVSTLALGGKLLQDESKAIKITFNRQLEPEGEATSTNILVRRGKNKNLSVKIEGPSKLDIESIDNPFAMYVPGLAGIPATEPYRTPAALRRAAARGDANAVLRNILLSLRDDQEAWTGFSQNLNRVFSDHAVAVKFNQNVDEFVDARVTGPRGSLPIDAAGTGFLQTVQILAYTAKYRPKLLLLDEPDSHIHPDKQRQLIRLLAELAEAQDFQVLIATHSRHLLDELNFGAKLHWMSGGKRIDEEHVDIVKVLTELGALDRGDLLKSGEVDVVVLTEDSKQDYLYAILEASGLDINRTQVWSYSGCTKLDTATVLARFIQENAPSTEIVIHRDRDYLEDEDVNNLKGSIKKRGLHPFITTGTDIESHFLSVEHISELYEGLTEQQINQVIDDAIERKKEDSVRLLADTLYGKACEQRKAENRSGRPNVVEITDQARTKFNENPKRWTHGKKTIGKVVSELQRLLRQNPNIKRPSSALAVDDLIELANAMTLRNTQEYEGNTTALPE